VKTCENPPEAPLTPGVAGAESKAGQAGARDGLGEVEGFERHVHRVLHSFAILGRWGVPDGQKSAAIGWLFPA